MRLRPIFIAATAFASLGALAEGNKAVLDTSASMQSHAKSLTIKQAQQKLSAAGYDAGPADGIMGAKTKQAVKDFQQAKGFEATGQLDQRTLTALGASGGVGGTPGSAPEASVGAPAEQRSSGSEPKKGY
jgi:peptidoglycan hydrolase-like protein with peptidoglycan-binding domain